MIALFIMVVVVVVVAIDVVDVSSSSIIADIYSAPVTVINENVGAQQLSVHTNSSS